MDDRRPKSVNETRNWKLLQDPLLRKNVQKLYRFDGVVHPNSSHNVHNLPDPRASHLKYINKSSISHLPIPTFTVDANYIGQPPLTEVSFCDLNDNVSESLLADLCRKCGDVAEVSIYQHPIDKRHSGVARVVFLKAKSAALCARKYNEVSIMGKTARVLLDPLGKHAKRIVDRLTSQKLTLKNTLNQTTINDDHNTRPSTSSAVVPNNEMLPLSASSNTLNSVNSSSDVATPRSSGTIVPEDPSQTAVADFALPQNHQGGSSWAAQNASRPPFIPAPPAYPPPRSQVGPTSGLHANDDLNTQNINRKPKKRHDAPLVETVKKEYYRRKKISRSPDPASNSDPKKDVHSNSKRYVQEVEEYEYVVSRRKRRRKRLISVNSSATTGDEMSASPRRQRRCKAATPSDDDDSSQASSVQLQYSSLSDEDPGTPPPPPPPAPVVKTDHEERGSLEQRLQTIFAGSHLKDDVEKKSFSSQSGTPLQDEVQSVGDLSSSSLTHKFASLPPPPVAPDASKLLTKSNSSQGRLTVSGAASSIDVSSNTTMPNGSQPQPYLECVAIAYANAAATNKQFLFSPPISPPFPATPHFGNASFPPHQHSNNNMPPPPLFNNFRPSFHQSHQNLASMQQNAVQNVHNNMAPQMPHFPFQATPNDAFMLNKNAQTLYAVYERNILDLKRVLHADILRHYIEKYAFVLNDEWCSKQELTFAFLKRREPTTPAKDETKPVLVEQPQKVEVKAEVSSNDGPNSRSNSRMEFGSEPQFGGIFGAGFRTTLQKLPSFKRKPTGPVTPPPRDDDHDSSQEELRSGGRKRGQPRSPSATPPPSRSGSSSENSSRSSTPSSSPRTRTTSPSLSGLDETGSPVVKPGSPLKKKIVAQEPKSEAEAGTSSDSDDESESDESETSEGSDDGSSEETDTAEESDVETENKIVETKRPFSSTNVAAKDNLLTPKKAGSTSAPLPGVVAVEKQRKYPPDCMFVPLGLNYRPDLYDHSYSRRMEKVAVVLQPLDNDNQVPTEIDLVMMPLREAASILDLNNKKLEAIDKRVSSDKKSKDIISPKEKRKLEKVTKAAKTPYNAKPKGQLMKEISMRTKNNKNNKWNFYEPALGDMVILPPVGTPAMARKPTVVIFKQRDIARETEVLYRFLTRGIDDEDIRLIQRAYEQLIEEQSACRDMLMKLHWAPHVATALAAPHIHNSHEKRRRSKDETQNQLAAAHASGSARTEGYYKQSFKIKRTFLTAYRQASSYEQLPSSLQVSEQTVKQQLQLSREARNNQRKLLSVMGDVESDILKCNQLKFRKKCIRFSKSAIHGWGLFAMEPIGPDEMVVEYVGEKVRLMVAEKREKNYERQGMGSSYLFRLDNDWAIDATKQGAVARFINHSCNPSCYAKIISLDGEKRIVIYSKQYIMQGEEITYDYKFPIEDVKIPCNCGAYNCRGSLN